LGQIVEGLPSAIIASLLGAFVGAVILWALQWSRQKRLAQKYSLAGDYLSAYEDHEGGVVVRQKAEVTFAQRGLKLYGTTSNLSDTKAWHIELTIDRARFLHGVYWAQHPGDSGTGVVFLQQQTNGVLSGIWSGYDDVNQQVDAGRYWFWPKPKLVVRRLDKADTTSPQALDLLRTELGARYITPGAFAKYVAADGTQPYRCAWIAVDRHSHRFVGVLIAEIVTEQTFEESLLEHYKSLAHSHELYRLRNSTTGLIKSMAVDPAYTRRGVGTDLVRAALADLEAHGARMFYALGWVRPDGTCPIKGVLTAEGFAASVEIEDFWTQDSITNSYDCPIDGNPCHCSALLLIKPLSRIAADELLKKDLSLPNAPDPPRREN
jgi:ribosomal protein S18 acetylase RimI-like enzyme